MLSVSNKYNRALFNCLYHVASKRNWDLAKCQNYFDSYNTNYVPAESLMSHDIVLDISILIDKYTTDR